jgi:soluble lytic murein transglycosylase-like protein
MNITRLALQRQLAYVRKSGFFTLLKAAADKYDLPVAYVLAIASRETNMRHMLGDGDHGVGIIQIDIRYHEIAARMKADGTWKTQPGPLVDYGVKLLRTNYNWAQREWPQYGERGWRKIAASAYNSGQGNTRKSVAEGDSDLRTTGDDYGKDVLARMEVLEDLLS